MFRAQVTIKYKPPPGSAVSFVLKPGDIVEVTGLGDDDGDWYTGRLGDQDIVFPSGFVTRLEAAETPTEEVHTDAAQTETEASKAETETLKADSETATAETTPVTHITPAIPTEPVSESVLPTPAQTEADDVPVAAEASEESEPKSTDETSAVATAAATANYVKIKNPEEVRERIRNWVNPAHARFGAAARAGDTTEQGDTTELGEAIEQDETAEQDDTAEQDETAMQDGTAEQEDIAEEGEVGGEPVQEAAQPDTSTLTGSVVEEAASDLKPTPSVALAPSPSDGEGAVTGADKTEGDQAADSKTVASPIVSTPAPASASAPTEVTNADAEDKVVLSADPVADASDGSLPTRSAMGSVAAAASLAPAKPEPPKKPVSNAFRDRIAAFNQPKQDEPVAPRPLPPKKPLKKWSIPSVDSSAAPSAASKGKPSDFSSDDAMNSIKQGGGGLKARIAALQKAREEEEENLRAPVVTGRVSPSPESPAEEESAQPKEAPVRAAKKLPPMAGFTIPGKPLDVHAFRALREKELAKAASPSEGEAGVGGEAVEGTEGPQEASGADNASGASEQPVTLQDASVSSSEQTSGKTVEDSARDAPEASSEAPAGEAISLPSIPRKGGPPRRRQKAPVNPPALSDVSQERAAGSATATPVVSDVTQASSSDAAPSASLVEASEESGDGAITAGVMGAGVAGVAAAAAAALAVKSSPSASASAPAATSSATPSAAPSTEDVPALKAISTPSLDISTAAEPSPAQSPALESAASAVSSPLPPQTAPPTRSVPPVTPQVESDLPASPVKGPRSPVAVVSSESPSEPVLGARSPQRALPASPVPSSLVVPASPVAQTPPIVQVPMRAVPRLNVNAPSPSLTEESPSVSIENLAAVAFATEEKLSTSDTSRALDGNESDSSIDEQVKSLNALIRQDDKSQESVLLADRSLPPVIGHSPLEETARASDGFSDEPAFDEEAKEIPDVAPDSTTAAAPEDSGMSEEEERRARIAARMAKLGGMRMNLFGAPAPSMPSRAVPVTRDEPVDEVNPSEEDATYDETPRSDDRFVPRGAVMLPGMALPGLRRKAAEAEEDESVPSPVSPAPPRSLPQPPDTSYALPQVPDTVSERPLSYTSPKAPHSPSVGGISVSRAPPVAPSAAPSAAPPAAPSVPPSAPPPVPRSAPPSALPPVPQPDSPGYPADDILEAYEDADESDYGEEGEDEDYHVGESAYDQGELEPASEQYETYPEEEYVDDPEETQYEKDEQETHYEAEEQGQARSQPKRAPTLPLPPPPSVSAEAIASPQRAQTMQLSSSQREQIAPVQAATPHRALPMQPLSSQQSAGPQIFTAAHQLKSSKESVNGERMISYCLARAGITNEPAGAYQYGAVVLSIVYPTDPQTKKPLKNAGPATTQQSDPVSGDIAVFWDVRVKHGPLSSKLLGSTSVPHLSVVDSFDAKKRKLRVLEAAGNGVEEAAYRLDDLKTGALYIYRL